MENDKTNDIIDVDVIKEEVIEEEKTEEAKEPEKKPTFKEEAIDFIKTFVICLGAVWLLTTFVFTPVRVDGMSMYPTLHDDDLGIASIFSAKYLKIERFDVVVVNDKAANSKDHWVKRVIGLPGETISCMDDVVYINGEPIEEPFLDTEYANTQRKNLGFFTSDFDEVTLGEDEYFVMGDNRTNSTDSRYVGPFTRDNITCKDVLIYYPFSNFKLVK
ncbi:signal peptidase I [Dielma fastidiosa]|uniref:signal peptidase I n=1 Tax=Dielma fastidiosa TaxID=1034346 RepID=UPI003563BC9A